MLTQESRVKLRHLLARHFSNDELKTLCFDLGVDYEALPGDSKESKVRELISYFERHNRINDIASILSKQRPRLMSEFILKLHPDDESIGLFRVDGIKWNKTGNLFWLGNDLRWAIETFRHDDDKGLFIHCLEQAAHHATELGFGSYGRTPIRQMSMMTSSHPQWKDWLVITNESNEVSLIDTLLGIKGLIQNYPDDQKIIPYLRQSIEDSLSEILNFISTLAEANQANFKSRAQDH